MRKPALTHLGRGALIEVHESRSVGNITWSRVRIVDLETLSPRMGWVDSSQVERVPLEQYPADADLLKELGGAYLDDFARSHTAIARFLVRQGSPEPVLACFLGSPVLPQARLQTFRRSQGKFIRGTFLEFPFSEMKAGISALEVRDLVNDGNECLVTHEPFSFGLENSGVNCVIRRIEGNELKTVWQAPLEHRNLASFAPKFEVLKPPEKNIGAPGTVTQGAVDFRARNSRYELVWKGKVEFYVFGREEPVESVPIEKVCTWDGTKFKALN